MAQSQDIVEIENEAGEIRRRLNDTNTIQYGTVAAGGGIETESSILFNAAEQSYKKGMSLRAQTMY
jgi:hypothetical protein